MAKKKSSSSRSRRRFRFVLTFIGLAIILLIIGFAGFQWFKVWRADDLAEKARENFEAGNYRIAWVQIRSARDMQPKSSEVLRSSAIIEAGFGSKDALGYWNTLAQQSKLSKEDMELRTRAVARFGSDEEFAQVMSDFEKVGAPETVVQIRAARLLDRGNADMAIEEMRRSASVSDDPAVQLDLIRLLLRRYMDRLTMTPEHPISVKVTDEIATSIDKLQGTPLANEALAIGLAFLPPDHPNMSRWADAAMQDLMATNPALVPAARRLVALGKSTPEELNKKLRATFDAAPLKVRATYAEWLTNEGLPREALALLTDQEASESEQAFLARADALAAMKNWDSVLQLSNISGNAPDFIRLLTRARAEYALGRGEQSGSRSVADAMRAASRGNEIQQAMDVGDSLGAGATVDATLIELAGDPRVGARAFAIARNRFGRRGPEGVALMSAAYERASKAVPEAVEVADYSRYLRLLQPKNAEKDAQYPSPEETAAAIAQRPDNVALRMTHVLALLRAGRAPEALNLLDEFTIAFNRMTPGQQAVLAAAFAANGRDNEAKIMVQAIDKSKLSAEEAQLLGGIH